MQATSGKNRKLEGELPGFGTPVPTPGLNSFWERPATRSDILEAFKP
jgi:hypothetical protein